jgi:hypothetical protein
MPSGGTYTLSPSIHEQVLLEPEPDTIRLTVTGPWINDNDELGTTVASIELTPDLARRLAYYLDSMADS